MPGRTGRSRRSATLLGGLAGAPVLVLGITYREGVKELAYSRAIPLIDGLRAAGADVAAYDPLLDAARGGGAGRPALDLGRARPVPRHRRPRRPTAGSRALDTAWFPDLAAVYDGRNSLRALDLPDGVAYVGVGRPGRDARRARVARRSRDRRATGDPGLRLEAPPAVSRPPRAPSPGRSAGAAGRARCRTSPRTAASVPAASRERIQGNVAQVDDGLLDRSELDAPGAGGPGRPGRPGRDRRPGRAGRPPRSR